MFQLINFISFCEHSPILKLMAATRFKKTLGQRQQNTGRVEERSGMIGVWKEPPWEAQPITSEGGASEQTVQQFVQRI